MALKYHGSWRRIISDIAKNGAKWRRNGAEMARNIRGAARKNIRKTRYRQHRGDEQANIKEVKRAVYSVRFRNDAEI